MSEDRLRRHLAPGELLFRQGQHGDAAFVIESGTIEIFSERDGARQLIATLGSNDIFGEMALLGDAVRTASACATEETRLLVVTHEHLNERLLAADPMTRHLLRTVVLRCREMLGWVRATGGAVQHPSAPTQRESNQADRELAFARLRTEQELETALERQEFELHFQPILQLTDRKLAGYEALLRWFKPGHGMVSPAEFIPVAETSSLINRIGAWVIVTAVDSLIAMDDAAGPSTAALFMTINLSARQLSDPNLLPLLAVQVQRLAGRQCQIKLELTESLMISNVSQVQRLIAGCRALGMDVVLDDFGTGYCSLSYLHLFEVQTMKLDRSFTVGMAVSSASEKIVSGITRLAHDLGLQVVIEGVERLEDADQAQRLGIDYVQGFFYGRAAPLAIALAQIKAESPSR